MKAAVGSEQWAEQALVPADQADQQSTHGRVPIVFQVRSSPAASRLLGILAAPGAQRTTISSAGNLEK